MFALKIEIKTLGYNRQEVKTEHT